MEYIDKRLQEIFLMRTGIDFQKEKKEMSLLGEKLNIPVRELVLIYLDIEKEFGIQIKEKEVSDGGFKSYSSIKSLIQQHSKSCD